MKRSLLLLFTVLISSVSLRAQITLGNVNTQFYEADNTTSIEGHLDVINNNASPIDIDVIRTIEVMNPNHTEAFCFGLYCYLPGTDSSAASTPVNGGTTESTFKALIDPLGNDGYDRIHYRIYDHNNIADSVGITMEFFFGTVGVAEHSNESYLKFNNEVNSFTVLNFRLPVNTKEARIDVHNMLGSRITTIPVSETQGMKVLNTSDLSNGMYLVSMVANKKVVHSYRMVVNHNKGN